jgi:hypothetical protein
MGDGGTDVVPAWRVGQELGHEITSLDGERHRDVRRGNYQPVLGRAPCNRAAGRNPVVGYGTGAPTVVAWPAS